MSMWLKSVRLSTTALILLGVCLAVVVAQRIRMGAETQRLLATPAKRVALPDIHPKAQAASTDLQSIRDGALFHVSRRFYVPPPPPAVPLAPPRPAYRLAGTFVSPRKPAVALLTATTGGVPRRVHVGDDLGGWQVTSVESRRVTLEYHGEQMEITGEHIDKASGLIAAPLAFSSTSRRGGGGLSRVNSGSPAGAGVKVLGGSSSHGGRTREVAAVTSLSDVPARFYRPPPK